MEGLNFLTNNRVKPHTIQATGLNLIPSQELAMEGLNFLTNNRVKPHTISGAGNGRVKVKVQGF